MDEGSLIGALARELYPDGRLIAADRHHIPEALRETQKALVDGVPAVFEATFRHSNVLVRVDILKRVREGFHLIEVKSATRLKGHFAYDGGIQRYVLEGAGLSTSDTRVMTLNRDYEYDGGRHDPARLFVTHRVVPIGAREITAHLNDQFAALARQDPPEVKIDGQCSNPSRSAGPRP